ncbi:hypothetical protein M8818_000942 [Zalaria obscura]|uniref:Uncharacterized protein n=1 Tax=Zalaria obscura TaxID=2024903 RepID=A0ACC3SM97_9PEZI
MYSLQPLESSGWLFWELNGGALVFGVVWITFYTNPTMLSQSIRSLRPTALSTRQTWRFASNSSSSNNTSASSSSSSSPSKDQQQTQNPPSSDKAQEASPKKRKTQAELDEELRLKMSGLAGDGGDSGVEYEDGQPTSMKRSVRNNMFSTHRDGVQCPAWLGSEQGTKGGTHITTVAITGQGNKYTCTLPTRATA